jgi:hypothetical protein
MSWVSPRRAREQGAALPMALAFLVLFAVLIAVVMEFASTSFLISARLNARRNHINAANGAVETAIKYLQNDDTKGTFQDPTCNASFFQAQGVNGENITVSCDAQGSGGSTSTNAPKFAVLTLAEGSEYGISQVQAGRLLRIKGDVYTNSEVQSDPGNPLDAQRIQVTGNVKIDAPCYDVDRQQPAPPLTWNCDSTSDQYLQDTPVPDPDGGISSSDPDLQDPANADPAGWAPLVTSRPPPATVPPCASPGTFGVISFEPGTYTDAAALRNLMNGSCPNKVFWFKPGLYYFDFLDAGSHEWTINDASARIVGGLPTLVPETNNRIEGGPVTWRGTSVTQTGTWTAQNNPLSNPPGCAPLTNANVVRAISECVQVSSNSPPYSRTDFASTGTRTITISGFQTTQAEPIPSLPGLQVKAVDLRVRHRESHANAAAQVTITPTGGSACPAITVPPNTTSNFVIYRTSVLSCLDTPAKINRSGTAAVAAEYTVSCSSNCSSRRAELDGIELDVTYEYTYARPAWGISVDANNPSAGVSASVPSVPGSCRHDGDGGWIQADPLQSGVQFAFGADSRINLQRGKFELCDIFGGGNRQEIVVYGLKNNVGGSGSGSATWTPTTADAPIPPTPPPTPCTPTTVFCNPANALVIAETPAVLSADTDFSSQPSTRGIRLSPFQPSPTAIPADATNITVALDVSHLQQGVAGASNSTARDRISQLVRVRSATNGTELCTIPVSDGTSSSSFTLVTPTIPSACSSNAFTRAQLNAGLWLDYEATYGCGGSSSCGSSTYRSRLDGIRLRVSWETVGLRAQSGCVNNGSSYYNSSGTASEANGTCAVFKVAADSKGGGNPRVAVFWGTVYTPRAPVEVPVDTITVPIFNRGVVARTLAFGSPQNNTSVSLSETPVTVTNNDRTVLLAATVGNVTVRARVILPFGQNTARITSWEVT